jgi:hypothetical protein
VNVNVPGPAGEPRRRALPGEQGGEPAAAAGAQDHLGRVLGAGEPQHRFGHVVAGNLLEGATK